MVCHICLAHARERQYDPQMLPCSTMMGAILFGEEVDDTGNDVGEDVGWPKNTSFSNNDGSYEDEVGELDGPPQNDSLAQ